MQTNCPILTSMDFDGRDVLNVGFGSGWLEQEHMQAARSILSLDLRDENVTQMRSAWPADAPDATFEQANIIEYALPPDAFDIVLYVDSF